MPLSRGSSQPTDQIQVSHMQADSLPSKPPGKPKNTGVGSLSLLQGIFLTQELNWGLLHCRWILYQLSYQESPDICITNSLCCTPETNTTLYWVGQKIHLRFYKMVQKNSNELFGQPNKSTILQLKKKNCFKETQQTSSTSPFPSPQLSISQASGSYLLNIPCIFFSQFSRVLLWFWLLHFLDGITDDNNDPKAYHPLCYGMIFFLIPNLIMSSH